MAAPDSRQISSTIDIEEVEIIQRIADKETRGNFSLMVAILLAEALQSRKKQSHKTEKSLA